MERTILLKEEETGRRVGGKGRKRRRTDRDIIHANMKSDSCQFSVLIAGNLYWMLVPVFDDLTEQRQVLPSVNQILNIFVYLFYVLCFGFSDWIQRDRVEYSEYIILCRILKLVCDVTTHDTCKTASASSAQIVPDSIWLERTMNTHVCRGVVPF